MRKSDLWKKVCFTILLCAATAVTLPAQTLTTLYSFNGADGSTPRAGLMQAADGNLYGTTWAGGAAGPYGTVFKMAPDGTLTTLHSFNGADGGSPCAALVQAADGNFYGTTWQGGTDGYGTAFKMASDGTLTTLHTFKGTDGRYPSAGLVQDAGGNFYGTTEYGGDHDNGTVFKITPDGTLTTLHSFDGTDGAYTQAGLVQASDGEFYGTTYGGGASGGGVVFKIAADGALTTLHSFNGADGSIPRAGLVQAADGNFYGTTSYGGTDNLGTVFKITPDGALTTLYSFCLPTSWTCGPGGTYPYAGLVQAADGNFYGTTTEGGANNYGTVFRLTNQTSDTTPPALNLPGPITLVATETSGATVTFEATATDLVDGDLPLDCTPASGTGFSVGPTTVTCSATDHSGNQATGSFLVTVTDFSLGQIPPMTLLVGGTGSAQVEANSQYGFNSAVTLSVSVLPSGVTALFGTASTTTVTPPPGAQLLPHCS